VGPVHAAIPLPDALAPALALTKESAAAILVKQLPLALVLALVGSLESLLSAAVLDRVAQRRHNGNRELIGQGLGNLVGAVFGGVPSTGAPMRGMASYKAGGRTRLAGALHSVFLLALLVWGTPALERLPYSVMAGVMIMIAVAMVDTWPLALLRRDGRRFGGDFLVVVAVAGVTVVFNLAAAVAVGIFFAVLQFVVNMSRPIVRRVFDRSMAKSRRVRPLTLEQVLSGEGHRIGVVELDGPLFFGTAEDLSEEIGRLDSDRPKVVVLEMRRMSHIDLSGARILVRIAQAQAAKGCRVFLAGIEPGSAHGQWLAQTGVGAAIPPADWFPTLDRAMEAAEDLLLGEHARDDGSEVALDAMSIVEGLGANDLAAFKKQLVRRHYHRGDLVFRNGAPCDGLYFLVSGHLEVRMPASHDHKAVRLATFLPGTILGELALLDGGRRSADAVAVSDAVAYHMSMEAFEKFRTGRPRAATQLLFNMSRALADRLRLTNALLYSAE
jgi:SulP family sulfate permease